MPRLCTRMQRGLAADFASQLSKTTGAASLSDRQQRAYRATLGLNLLVGARYTAGIPGFFLLAALRCQRSFGPGRVAHAPSSTEQPTAVSSTEEAALVILAVNRLVHPRRGSSHQLPNPRRWFTAGVGSWPLVPRVIPGDAFTSLGFSKPPPNAWPSQLYCAVLDAIPAVGLRTRATFLSWSTPTAFA
nr:uncharacterized protein LOC126516428 [Dermacentor andersoni]